MKLLADGLFQLKGFPPNAVNVYLMNGVLIDAGTRFDRGRILRQLKGQAVTAHALTHAHPDHQGSSHAVCEALGVPFWCGALDADAAKNSALIYTRQRKNPATWLANTLAVGPGHPVSRRLREGDDVAGFRVIETPGHTPGHVAYWREKDRTLVLGDVLINMNIVLGTTGLHQPPGVFTMDPAQDRQSARKLARLEPALVCFGHGPPLSDTGRFVRFIDRLKD